MKLAVFGSRTLRGDEVASLIMDEVQKTNADTLVTSQEPLGVCTVAQRMAKSEHLTLELHFLNFRYGMGVYRMRSKAIIEASDKVLLIHDGKSKGTSNELELVQKLGKPYRYEVLAIDTLQHQLGGHLEAFTADTNKDDFGDDFDI